MTSHERGIAAAGRIEATLISFDRRLAITFLSSTVRRVIVEEIAAELDEAARVAARGDYQAKGESSS